MATTTNAETGRPTKYNEETLALIYDALSDGLTQKQACIASGISEDTLPYWKKQHPELGPKLEAAREEARKKALAGIKAFGDKDWRALESFLKLSFRKDYRDTGATEVNVGVAVGLVCSEDQRKHLIEVREKLASGTVKITPAQTLAPAATE